MINQLLACDILTTPKQKTKIKDGNHRKEEIRASKSNAVSDTLQNTNIILQDDSNQESEDCDHFSIREYVAQARERDPHSCSPFETDNLSLDLLPLVSDKKFRRWDCSACVSKVVSTDRTGNEELALSSDQSANNDAGTCVISFLGTSLVPLSVRDDAGPSESLPSSMNGSNSKKDVTCAATEGCHLWSTPCAASPDTSDNKPLSTFIRSEKSRIMKEPEGTKVHAELEKSKEIHELMATTSKNSDLPENPVVSKISKVHGKKARKVRSMAEIIGNDKLVTPQNKCSPHDSMLEDLKLVKENQASEAAGRSGLINAKLKKKYKALEVVVPSLKACSPVDSMDEYCTPMKRNQGSELVCRSVLMKAKPKKNYMTVVVVPSQKEHTSAHCMDEYQTPIEENRASEVACRSGLIKMKSKKKYKALEVVDETFSKLRLKKGKKTISHDKCIKIKNLEGQNLTYPPPWGHREKPSTTKSGEKQLLIGTVVRRKRTKKPRKFVCAFGTEGKIACMKSCHNALQSTGNKEANSKKEQLKIVSQKRKVENSRPECSAQRIRKKKQKISENISNDIPMDIVELLAKSLREKHLTDEMDCHSNSNTNLDSRESPQTMPPDRTVINFSTQKTAFDRTSETSAFKYVLHPIHCQSSAHTGNIHLSTARIDPTYGYMTQFSNGSVVQQLGNGRCLDLGCTLLQLNANSVSQMEFYRNEVIPAVHLLQLMNSSTSSSPSLNVQGFTKQYNPPVITNHYQNLNQNTCKLVRPQPRLGVFGSQLQKEITSPANNCGTQSGYRIGNGPIPAEGICVVNRNPADFTVIDENNEFIIDGREIRPVTGAFYGNLDGVAYLSRGSNNDNRVLPASGFCTTVL